MKAWPLLLAACVLSGCESNPTYSTPKVQYFYSSEELIRDMRSWESSGGQTSYDDVSGKFVSTFQRKCHRDPVAKPMSYICQEKKYNEDWNKSKYYYFKLRT
ncbi:hypothetical protein [Synechococcus sp. MIT S9220]|uniref:hypothetical protein n=1 Tax=Synechococcus sp. MIT S9220 TaxID=166309 RepID=UPI00164C510C|nr:hypothetical protein [Synechococcus sp. MIT S9220]